MQLMQVTFVIDCSNPMLRYVDHFKKETLKLIQDQDIEMEIAYVIYCANDRNTYTTAVPAVATKITAYPFKSGPKYNSDIIPSRNDTSLDAKSLQPIDVHRALDKALLFRWDLSAKRRILILIGKNPPHGTQYHDLDEHSDLYPKGVIYPDNNDILNQIFRRKIHLFIISIDNELDKFCRELMNAEYQQTIAHTWVRCVHVENQNDLTPKVLDCIVGDQDDNKAQTQSNDHESKVNKHTQSNEDHVSIEKMKPKSINSELKGQMRWIKQPTQHGSACYPVLVLWFEKEDAVVWDGTLIQRIASTSFYQRSDIAGYVHSLRQSDIAVKQLLNYSYATQQTLSVQRQQCEEEIKTCKDQCKQQIEQCKATYNEATNDIQRMIHEKIKTHDDIKWKRHRDGGYKPVLVLQHGDPNDQSSTSFVLDTNNITRAVKSTSLLDTPPYETEHHIASHVEQLDWLCANYPWKYAIECGTTECSFIVRGKMHINFLDKNVIGTIMGIVKTNPYQGWTKYQVERHDTRGIVEVYDDQNDFRILGPHDETSELQKTIDELKAQNKQLTSNVIQFQEELDTRKATVDSLQSNNDHLQSRIRKSTKDIASQNEEIGELTTECHKAIRHKDEFEEKYNSFTHQFDRLKQESDQLKRQYKEQRKLVAQLRDEKIEDSSALDLSRGFPPVQDIVNDFGTLKSHYHVEAAKQMKKALKQRHKE
eukprot:793865_1